MTNRKLLTPTDKINILELYKIITPKEIVLQTGFSKTAVGNVLRLYRISQKTDSEIIDRIIHQVMVDEEQEGIDYEKQQSCLHPLLFVKCPICKMTLSEKDRDKIIAIVSKYQPCIEKIRIEQTI